ncbi:MAG: hypothetical protein HUU28_04090 [Planctomycetaceae bacterium]|nr:hypothetical protein [Planctomycetaceae bacterium]
MNSMNILVAAALFCAPASAQSLQVIYCEIPASPKSVVPGALETTTGLPEATNFRALEDLFVSPDGSRWMIKARTQQGSDEENIMLLGSGLSGTMFAQEGQPVPGGVSGELVDFFGSGVGRFDSTNRFAYSLRARGGLSSTFQKVVVWNGTSSTITTQMGDLYTGLQDIPANPSGDETVGNSIGSIHLLDDGRVGAQDSTIGNISTTRRPAIFYDRAMFHQADVTSVTDLAGTGSITIDGVSANTFYSSPDGAHWVAIMDIDTTTSSNNSLVYDGRVVVQNNVLIPSTAITCGSIFASDIAADGRWYARGRDNSSTAASAPDWAVHQGVLIAKTGDPIGSSGLNFGDTFYAFSVNANGDWAIACNTNDANAGTNDVLVVNGEIVAREGDPVDVDGNGLFDDNAFLGRGVNTNACFQANDVALTDNGRVYFFATLRDGANADLGSNPSFGTPDVMIAIDLGPSCGASVSYCTAGTSTNGCVATISASGTASASAASGFTLQITNVEGQKSGLIFYSLTGAHSAPWGTGTSFLCVKSPTQRTGAQLTGGTLDACDGALTLDWNTFRDTHPSSLGSPFAGGEHVWAQGWYRDPPASKTTNLSNAIEFLVCP